MRFRSIVACIAVTIAAVDAGGFGQSCRDGKIDIYETGLGWHAYLICTCKKANGADNRAVLALPSFITNNGGNLAVRITPKIIHISALPRSS